MLVTGAHLIRKLIITSTVATDAIGIFMFDCPLNGLTKVGGWHVSAGTGSLKAIGGVDNSGSARSKTGHRELTDP